MSLIDNNKILEDFIIETKKLISSMTILLESVEGDDSRVDKLAEYGNQVDRIMGGAQSLAMLMPPDHALNIIGDYAALCKAVGYKSSQIQNNAQFFNICVALLMDITEVLQELVDRVDEPASVLRKTIPPTFFDRVKWVSDQFKGQYRESISYGTKEAPSASDNIKLDQSNIDELMKKLGMD